MVVKKWPKLFGQLLLLLLLGLLHKCNNIKQICFANKEFVRFNLIMLVAYEVSVDSFERVL